MAVPPRLMTIAVVVFRSRQAAPQLGLTQRVRDRPFPSRKKADAASWKGIGFDRSRRAAAQPYETPDDGQRRPDTEGYTHPHCSSCRSQSPLSLSVMSGTIPYRGTGQGGEGNNHLYWHTCCLLNHKAPFRPENRKGAEHLLRILNVYFCSSATEKRKSPLQPVPGASSEGSRSVSSDKRRYKAAL